MFEKIKRVLIVDDMAMMRKVVQKFCAENGMTNVATANDGVQAWALLSNPNESFDLVISDWNMPNMTGTELLKKVRADERLKNTAFLMVTAEQDKSQIDELKTLGVTGYLSKPFTGEQFQERMKQVYQIKFAA